MHDFNDTELIQRLERLGQVKPTPEAVRHALDRVRGALVPRTLPAWKSILKGVAVAAAVVLVVGAIAVWLVPSGSSASLADVQEAMKATGSVTCRQISREEGKEEVSRFSILANGLMRFDRPGGEYSVMDTKKYRTLVVNPRKREALLWEGFNAPQVNFYEFLKNLPKDASARALPGKKIDGKDVLGFAVKWKWKDVDHPPQDLTVWADAKSRLPVRIEFKSPDDKTDAAVFDELVFDARLDAKLFSFEPPAGYKLETRGTAEFPSPPDDPQLKDLVVTPCVGLGPVKFRMSREEVEKLLGKPDSVSQPSTTGAVDMSYASRGFFVIAGPKLGVVSFTCVDQKVMAVRVRNFSGKTDKGIALGATAAEIIRAYGEPDSKETNGDLTSLSFNKLHAMFSLVDDKLVQMIFNVPRPLQ